MRCLLLTRGMPLCGKTAWVQQHNLEPYTLDPKLFNTLIQAPMLNDSGDMGRESRIDRAAYHMLFAALEARMERGDFIIIDDRHIAKSYCSHYKEMAKRYAYEVILVDFSDVPLETIHARNKECAMSYSQEEIHTLYTTLKQSEVPIKCKSIKPEEIDSLLHAEPHNLNGYKVIHHIGDIQGSYNVLQKYLGTMKNDEFYIFLGDYIDRGFQNYEVLQFLLKIMDKKNVCLLEGNHEKWLWEWSNNRAVESREFRFNTQVELEQKGLNKNDARRFYLNLKPYFFYKFHDKRVICTHGGISNVPKHPILLSATQSIYGVGSYLNANSIAQSFSVNAPKNFYQVFGHRNKTNLPMCLHNKSFLLESQVEFGGYLRALQLNQHGFQDKSIRNTIFVPKEEKEAQRKLQKFFDCLQQNKKLIMRQSKNFAGILPPSKLPKDFITLPHALNHLIIDTKKWQIAGRGHHLSSDKTPLYHANKKEIANHITYPLRVTRKLYGRQFLIAYYNAKFLCFQDYTLMPNLPEWLIAAKQNLAAHFKNTAHSMLFLQTSEDSLYLLDVFANTTQPNPLPPDERAKIATMLNVQTQNTLYTLHNQAEFESLLRNYNAYNIHVAKSHALQTAQNLVNLNSQVLQKPQDSHKDSPQDSQDSQNSRNSIMPQNSDIPQDSHTLALHVLETPAMQSESSVFLSGLYFHDELGNFLEIPTRYDHEMQVIGELIKIWRMRNSIAPLTWITNEFRKAFLAWFMQFSVQKDWKNMPLAWIQNAFLCDLAAGQHNCSFHALQPYENLPSHEILQPHA